MSLPATWADQRPIGSYAIDIPPPVIGQYAGYISVQVSSTSNDMYVRIMYSNYVEYDNTVDVGIDGIALFPIIGEGPIITVATHNTIQAIANVTIIYYY